MNAKENQEAPSHVFEGGTMDCGSGLILLIRQNMLHVPVGGILEIRSSEPTVETELPPWCRMVGHEHIKSVQLEEGNWRHWVRRGTDEKSEQQELDADRSKALEFKWSLRARRTAEAETTVYSRNFSWQSGASIDFDRKGKLPGALEQLLGALLSDVIHCFAVQCSREGLVLDDLEATLGATLNNSLAAVGIEEGDSSIKEIKLVVYVTTGAREDDVHRNWNAALETATTFQTLSKACSIDSRLVCI